MQAVRATGGAGSGSTKWRLVVERLWAVRLEKMGLSAGPAALMWGKWPHLWACSLVNSSLDELVRQVRDGSALQTSPAG